MRDRTQVLMARTKLIRELPVPLLADVDRERIAGSVREAYRQRDVADQTADALRG